MIGAERRISIDAIREAAAALSAMRGAAIRTPLLRVDLPPRAGTPHDLELYLKLDAAHFVEVREALAMEDREQILLGERFALHGSFVDLAVLDQNCGMAFDSLGQPARFEEGARDQPIDGDQ